MLPAERGLRRVIGDGESVPDGEVEGLDESDFLELYRQLVLLRTYDERSLVYHRQGRIGTYAIFWNHEAMQVGSHYALERDDWIFPSYRESAIGLLRGMPPATVLSWWRGHPAGWWNPLDYNLASICVPIATHVPHAAGLAWGKKLRGEKTVAIVYFGDGATSEGAFHEGANFAGVLPRAARPLLQQQPVGDLDAPVRPDGRADARRQGDRLRHAGAARGRGGRARSLRRDTRGGRAGTGRRRPDADRGGHLSLGAARDGRRPDRVHRRGAGRGGAGAGVSGPVRAVTCAGRASSTTRSSSA